MALNFVQQQLEGIYRISVDYDVEDFLITDPELARQLDTSAEARQAREKLLVRQTEQNLDLSLYLDRQVVDGLAGTAPEDWFKGHAIDPFLVALEGVSHFLYVTWNAGFQKPVTLMELEMQAEVDKFIMGALVASVCDDTPSPEHLLDTLFARAEFDESLSDNAAELYRSASRYAGRYCHHLMNRFRGVYGGHDMMQDLRYFYRLAQPGKVRHIDSTV